MASAFARATQVVRQGGLTPWIGLGAIGAVSGSLKAHESPLLAEDWPEYKGPPRFSNSFAALPNAAPKDDRALTLAWAVKNLKPDKVRLVLEKWPKGAELVDTEDNTLFHVLANETARYGAQPEAAKEVMQLLLSNGWPVVDMKNKRGERAEVVACNSDPCGLPRKLLVARSHDFQEPLRSEEPCPLVMEQSPVPWQWEYLVQDEQRRSWAGVLRGAVPESKLREWTETTRSKAPWITSAGIPRKVAWFVSEECADCPYRYSGLEYPATVFPDFMQEIRREVCSLCGIPPESYPNSCNVNLYETQNSDVGWHSDDEVYFQSLSGDTRIISFSLGVPRDFCWRLQGTDKTLGSASLGDGDIMTMEGLFQKHYKHSVPASNSSCGARINFTFRWIRVKAHAEDAGTVAVK